MRSRDFCRDRKLDVVRTIGLVLHMAAHSNDAGYAITAQDFFSELDIENETPCKQSVSDARAKLKWEAFRYLLEESQHDGLEERWHGHRVRIFDGTKINLPHRPELLKRFAIPSGGGKLCHYPQAWMVTLLNPSSGQPIAMELGCHKEDPERSLMLKMIDRLDTSDVALIDRGLGGAKIYLEFIKRGLNFVHRVTTYGGGVAHYVAAFIDSNRASQLVAVPAIEEDGEEIVLWLRLIKGPIDSDGKRIVFATSLLDEDQYSAASLRELYRSRWGIETMYGRVKNLLCLEKFHARSYNGIMQEIYANLLIISLTALVESLASRKLKLNRDEVSPSFKAATHVIRRHLGIIVGQRNLTTREAKRAANKMIDEAGKVLARKQPGRRCPRVSMQPIKIWNLCRDRKMKGFRSKRRRAS